MYVCSCVLKVLVMVLLKTMLFYVVCVLLFAFSLLVVCVFVCLLVVVLCCHFVFICGFPSGHAIITFELSWQIITCLMPKRHSDAIAAGCTVVRHDAKKREQGTCTCSTRSVLPE